MEKEAQERKQKAAEMEKQKFQDAIARQCMEDDMRMMSEHRASRTSISPAKKKTSPDQKQKEWEQIRRAQEEQVRYIM